MYLKQKSLKISGSRAELIDQVLTQAGGNLSARDTVDFNRRNLPGENDNKESLYGQYEQKAKVTVGFNKENCAINISIDFNRS